jgi:hypothetical protein
MLYKRAFRKEKEVVTFLIKDKMVKLAWNLRIEPRPYQNEAAERALARRQAACSLPSGLPRLSIKPSCGGTCLTEKGVSMGMIKFIFGGLLSLAGFLLAIFSFIMGLPIAAMGGATWAAIMWVVVGLIMFCAGIYLMLSIKR